MSANRDSYIKEWFRKARVNIASAEWLLQKEQPLTETAAFLCQQAAEKSIKGYLTRHRIGFGKTHNLEVLGKKVISKNPKLKKLMQDTIVLQEFAVEIRYPGEDDPPSADETRGYLKLAQKVVETLVSD